MKNIVCMIKNIFHPKNYYIKGYAYTIGDKTLILSYQKIFHYNGYKYNCQYTFYSIKDLQHVIKIYNKVERPTKISGTINTEDYTLEMMNQDLDLMERWIN